MSKKCDDLPDDSICGRKFYKSRSKSRNSRSSSKKKGCRDNETIFGNAGPSLKSNNESKRPHGIKDCRCTLKKSATVFYGPILKKTRVDHSTEPQITVCHNNKFGFKKNDQKKRDGKRTKPSNKVRRDRKKRSKKRKGKNCRNQTVWRSLVCARFIQFLFKICCCSAYLDSSSTSRPCTDTCFCRCSHCKCCFCRPKTDSKYIQCDEYEQSVCVASSKRESVDLHDSMNKASSCRANDKSKNSRKCVTQAKRESPGEKIKQDLLSVPCPGKSTDTSSDRPNYGNNIKKADKGTKSSEKGFMSLRCFRKRQGPIKPPVNERPIIEMGCSCGENNEELPTKKHCKFQETKGCECDLRIPCENENCGKTRKALLVMFDILFWPYTCLPRRRDNENKTEEKMC